MSGKLCPEHDVRISKAYCEGRLAAKNGILIISNDEPCIDPNSAEEG